MAIHLEIEEWVEVCNRIQQAEAQRDRLREALEGAVSEIEVMKNEIGYRAATIDVIEDCRATLAATEEEK